MALLPDCHPNLTLLGHSWFCFFSRTIKPRVRSLHQSTRKTAQREVNGESVGTARDSTGRRLLVSEGRLDRSVYLA